MEEEEDLGAKYEAAMLAPLSEEQRAELERRFEEGSIPRRTVS